MLDHLGIPVSDFERSKRFYGEALSPLGYELIMEPGGSAAGFGRSDKPDFWISRGEPGHDLHVAFAADDHATVVAFHEAAIAAGGRDNGCLPQAGDGSLRIRTTVRGGTHSATHPKRERL